MKSAQSKSFILEEVAEHFAQWRSHKKQGERIPEPLWCEAMGLLCDYPITRVVRTLRLSATDLKKHQRELSDTKNLQETGSAQGFVEVDRSLIGPALSPVASPVVIELHRPDGLRLRVECASGADMLALAERFMGS
jgi:hypothetical protein